MVVRLEISQCTDQCVRSIEEVSVVVGTELSWSHLIPYY